MDVVDGITTGATVILKKLSSIVENEIILVWYFKDEFKRLQSTLNMIMAVMEDAEKKQMSDAVVRLWMKDLKTIAYDAEDILDEYSYEVILWKHEKEEQDNLTFLNKVCNLCSNSSISFVRSWNLARQIKEINKRFKQIANCKNDLGLHTIDVGSSSSHELMMKNRETCSLVHKDWKFVGRENDKSKIINTALDKNSCFVIPIVGLGGMGKTTLAQQVYNDPDVKKHFDIKVWVCVSDPFDVKKLLKNIASSIGVAKQYDDAATMDDIACQLQDALRGNKFLLVLDDVWNENFEDWRKLKTPLMGGAKESKILVTTRSVKVAELMEDKFPHYELGILNDNHSWSLFKEIAFGSAAGAVETPKLMKIGKEMVKRCGGLPLALIFLGSLMRSKKKEGEWEIIRDTKLWHESREGKNSEILLSLRLSYDYLPSHLKLCFSYCCLFPKDQIIGRKQLIRLWMAEGFLIETLGENTMSMEEIGDEYFQSLLSGFFFQDVVKDDDGEVRSCKMHDLVHDLARSVVGNHECLVVESARDVELIFETTRRLNLVNHDEEILPKFLEAVKKAKNLRTIFVNEQIIGDIGNVFKENKRLRVLDLCCSVVTRQTASSFGGLKHLRYLGLPTNFIIPKEIGRLRFLQTLSEFDVGGGGIEELEGLNLLRGDLSISNHSEFDVGGGIEELEGLNLLRGDLSISNLRYVRSEKYARRANLKEKKNLRGLKLSWDDGGYANANDEAVVVLEGLQPHPNLRTLKIDGFEGAKLPRWIEDSSCLPNLVKLELRNCCYCEQIGALPSLRYLTLARMKDLQCIGNELYYSAAASSSSATVGRSSTTTITAFPSLKKLSLRYMLSLKEWVVPVLAQASTTTTTGAATTNYCFPLLEEITIKFCHKLTTITPTTTIFPSLKVLDLLQIDGRAAKTLVTNNLNSLTSMRLREIRNLISLPRQGLIENNNTLLSLVIYDCSQFKGFFQVQDDDPLSSFSSSSSSSSSLESLELNSCPDLRFYPNIRSLTSLRKLEIQHCNISKSLQDDLYQVKIGNPTLEIGIHSNRSV